MVTKGWEWAGRASSTRMKWNDFGQVSGSKLLVNYELFPISIFISHFSQTMTKMPGKRLLQGRTYVGFSDFRS